MGEEGFSSLFVSWGGIGSLVRLFGVVCATLTTFIVVSQGHDQPPPFLEMRSAP